MNKKLLLLTSGLLLGLGTTKALAQNSLPNQSPPATTTETPKAPAPAATAATEFTLGRTYRVETKTGGTFTGQLVSLSLNDLEFDTKEMGHVTVSRDQVRSATDMSAPTTASDHRPGYYDIGNGTRLFNAPTGRGLRKGQGSVMTTYLFLVGGEYGITDNFSIGASISLIPGVALSQQLFIISPRFSAPLSEKVHFGAGVVYANIPFDGSNSGGAGVGYGALTYGSADDNLTLGLGYGFTSGEIGRTPVLQLGGQKRISRRLSLVSENYLVTDSHAGMGGLYGLKFNSRSTSLGVAAGYVYLYPHDENQINYTYNPNTGTYTPYTSKERVTGKFIGTYIIPVYIDFAYRFGKK